MVSEPGCDEETRGGGGESQAASVPARPAADCSILATAADTEHWALHTTLAD